MLQATDNLSLSPLSPRGGALRRLIGELRFKRIQTILYQRIGLVDIVGDTPLQNIQPGQYGLRFVESAVDALADRGHEFFLHGRVAFIGMLRLEGGVKTGGEADDALGGGFRAEVDPGGSGILDGVFAQRRRQQLVNLGDGRAEQ